MRAIVWFGNVLLVDLNVTPRCPDDKVDDLRHSLCLVLVEMTDPLRSDIVEARPAREYLSCRTVNIHLLRADAASNLTIEAISILLD